VRHRKVGFLTKRKLLNIPFKYYPRTRAHRPIVVSPGFFSAIKSSPEEWYQVASLLKTRPHSRLEPIHTHLFIPAARIYSTADIIPFHLQLSGSLCSLQSFLVAPSCYKHAVIRVVLLREIVVETREKNISRNTVMAEGKLCEIPPSSLCEPQGDIHLDWEGEVRCSSDTSVGSFNAGSITVKDFILLDIKPSKHGSDVSPFLPLQVLVPIRLVTDSYLEETDYHDLLSAQ